MTENEGGKGGGRGGREGRGEEFTEAVFGEFFVFVEEEGDGVDEVGGVGEAREREGRGRLNGGGEGERRGFFVFFIPFFISFSLSFSFLLPMIILLIHFLTLLTPTNHMQNKQIRLQKGQKLPRI